MIKIEKTEVVGWEAAIRGMRNPINSWDKSDSIHIPFNMCDDEKELRLAKMCHYIAPIIKENDHNLMMKLRNAGTDHRKFMRMIVVYVDITAPLYWWKEFDTYKVGTVANSCSTMHKIHAKEFKLEDFSCERLNDSVPEEPFNDDVSIGVSIMTDNDTGCIAVVCRGDINKNLSYKDTLYVSQKDILDMFVIPALNANREAYLKTKDKKYWWQMIHLLPSSYNQKRTIMFSYEVLANIYKSRKNHKLDDWRDFCKWSESLPYSELITGEEK